MNIASIDLNLLVALKALLEEKHVSRAALRIGLSQPAMSRALGRLRQLLNDPLLVKGKSGLSLTSRASELIQPLQTIFIEINHIVSPPTANPALMQKEIVIATRDNEMVTVLPHLIGRIAKEAPGLTLRIIPLLGEDLDLLERQDVDFVMSGTDVQASTLYRHTLYKEDFVCLIAADNNVAKQGLNLKTFLKLKHCLVTITGFGPGLVDTVLSQKGLKREIAVRVPHFLAASYIVANSDLIVTLPRRIGLMLSHQKNIIMLESPVKLPSFPIYLYWHARHQNNPINKWLRKVMREQSMSST